MKGEVLAADEPRDDEDSNDNGFSRDPNCEAEPELEIDARWLLFDVFFGTFLDLRFDDALRKFLLDGVSGEGNSKSLLK